MDMTPIGVKGPTDKCYWWEVEDLADDSVDKIVLYSDK